MKEMNMAEMKKLERMPVWGTMSQRNFEFYTGKTQLKTRKALKAAFEAGNPVMYKKVQRRTYTKGSQKLVGSKILKCACGTDVVVDANTISVKCYKCTNMVAIKSAGFLHSRTVLNQESGEGKKKEKQMASKKKGTEGQAKSTHMSVEAIRERFDNPDKGRKPGYFVMVFGALKKAGTMTVDQLAEKVLGWKSTPEKYRDAEKLKAQIKFYSKTIWGKRTGLVKMEGDNLTYVAPTERS